MDARLKCLLKHRLNDTLSFLMGGFSLVGLVLTLVNPGCYLSAGVVCKFDLLSVWEFYPGKGAALQFFSTGLLAAVATSSWPALREQIACRNGKLIVECVRYCSSVGYLMLLFGILFGMEQKGQTVAALILVIPMALFIWVYIINLICNIIKFILQQIKRLYLSLISVPTK